MGKKLGELITTHWSKISIIMIAGIVLSDIFVTNKAGILALLENIGTFVTGNLSAITYPQHESLLTVFQNLALILILDFICMVVISRTLMLIFGKPEFPEEVKEKVKKALTFGTFPILITIWGEEVFARFIPGVLHNFFQGSLLFYVMLLAANLVWTAIHVTNSIANKKIIWRNVPFLLNQFTVGILIAFVFVKYGFYYALFLHVAHNAIAMRTEIDTSFRKKTWIVIGGSMLLSIALVILQQAIPGNSFGQFLATHHDFHEFNKFGLFPYVFIMVGYMLLGEGVSAWLHLDRTSVYRVFRFSKTVKNSKQYISLSLVSFFVLQGMFMFLSNWALLFLVPGTVERIVAVGLFATLADKISSASTISRSVLRNMIGSFAIVLAWESFGLGSACLLYVLFFAISSLPKFIQAVRCGDLVVEEEVEEQTEEDMPTDENEQPVQPETGEETVEIIAVDEDDQEPEAETTNDELE